MSHELAHVPFAWLALSGLAMYILSMAVIFSPLQRKKSLQIFSRLGYNLAALVLCGIILLLLPSILTVYIALTLFFIAHTLIAMRRLGKRIQRDANSNGSTFVS
ncbi:hypothetical protein D3C85_1708300 [compost metagenome]